MEPKKEHSALQLVHFRQVSASQMEKDAITHRILSACPWL